MGWPLSHRLLLLLLAATPALASQSGNNARVETTDGRVFQGAIQWQAGGVSIGSAGEPSTRLDLAEIQRLTLLPESSPATADSADGTGLLGFYYPGTNFQGSPMIRLDETIHFNWGWDIMPFPGFRHDLFSVRWTGRLQPPRTDVYTLFLGSDDGSRFWLDGQGPFSRWQRQDFAETNCTMRLEAGRQYDLQVEYFDYFGNAQVELSWSSSAFSKSIIPRAQLHASSPLSNHVAQIQLGPGLLATYHVGSLFGEPSFSRVEQKIGLDAVADFTPALQATRQAWDQTRRRASENVFNSADSAFRAAEELFAQQALELGEEIVPGVPSSFFTVRWSGQLRPETNGVHAFRVLTDEGVRFWLNEELITDRWNDLYPGEHKYLAKLTAGHPVSLRLETLNTDGQIVAKLFWTPPGQSEIPLNGSVLWPATPAATPIVIPSLTPSQPGGVLLSKGTFVPIQPEALDASALKFNGPIVRSSVPRPRVARIYFRPLSAEQQARVQPGRTGALLENGDFIEGEVLSLEGTQARIDSILFGRRTYHAPGPVAALILDGSELPPSKYRLAIRGLGTVLASDLRLTPSGVIVTELASHTFEASEVLELTRQ